MTTENEFIAEMACRAGETTRQRFQARIEILRRKCVSPAEERLLAALLYVLTIDSDVHLDAAGGFDVDFSPQDMTWPAIPHPFDGIYVYQQAVIGKFRADFLVALIDSRQIRSQKREHWIVIECDGHDFHERTKEQARRDRSRDRWMTSHGIIVHRFTGSEIWRDAIGCANEIESEICRLAYDQETR